MEEQKQAGVGGINQPKKLPQVFVGIPTANGMVADQIISSMMVASSLPLVAKLRIQSYSWLTRNFNDLFCHALNTRKEGTTHFLLMHADIVPEPMWLEKMLAIMKSHDADVLSAIVPIKNQSGFTSTALDQAPHEDAHELRVTRLTMHEVFTKYPPTFTHEKILLNTGLMLIDLRKPWVEEVYFRVHDAIEKDSEGNFYSVGMSEDWLFSKDARLLGAKLYATREVKVAHIGTTAFNNGRAWGVEKTDHDLSKTNI